MKNLHCTVLGKVLYLSLLCGMIFAGPTQVLADCSLVFVNEISVLDSDASDDIESGFHTYSDLRTPYSQGRDLYFSAGTLSWLIGAVSDNYATGPPT